MAAADGDDLGTPCMPMDPEAYYGTGGESGSAGIITRWGGKVVEEEEAR